MTDDLLSEYRMEEIKHLATWAGRDCPEGAVARLFLQIGVGRFSDWISAERKRGTSPCDLYTALSYAVAHIVATLALRAGARTQVAADEILSMASTHVSDMLRPGHGNEVMVISSNGDHWLETTDGIAARKTKGSPQ